MDINNIRFESTNQRLENLVDLTEKKGKSLERAIFEMVALFLIVAMFFFENGYLIVKQQSIVILLGNIAVMFIVTLLFDTNYRLKGKLYGFSSKKYVEARDRLQGVTTSLSDDDIKNLRENIDTFKEEKENRDICEKLYRVGIAKKDYDEKYKFLDSGSLKKANLTKKQIKAISKAVKVRKISLSAEMLMSDINFNDKKFLIGKSQGQLDKIHLAKSVTMYLLTAVLFAYFAVGLSKEFNLASLGWYLLKVCFLGFRGVKSYFEAFLEVTDRQVKRLQNQASYIEFFMNLYGVKEK